MQSALYVGLSAQVALEKRLQTIANNVANVNTAAFRTDVVKFETVLSKAGANPVAFSSPGDNIISREMGSITESGNPLDVAVVGQGWIAFAGPNGTVYTRDGRLQIAPSGEITQDNNEIGSIVLFNIPADASLERYGNSGVTPDRPATAIADFSRDGFKQGYVEGSGANPMMELTKLMAASRAFDGTNSMIEGTESSLLNAIRTLGEPGK